MKDYPIGTYKSYLIAMAEMDAEDKRQRKEYDDERRRIGSIRVGSRSKMRITMRRIAERNNAKDC